MRGNPFPTRLARLLVAALAAVTTTAGCASMRECPAPPVPPAASNDAGGPREALEQFLSAAEDRDFEVAWLWLAGDLRRRYTPARLRADFEQAEGVAVDKLARVHALLATDLQISGDTAVLAISPERAVRLVREAGRWRVAALE